MTSSLVGSEMCIRDRSSTCPGDGTFLGGLIAFGGPLPTGLCDIYVGSEADISQRQYYGNLSNIR
eukprot:1745471-Prorocentrum_lima.AAC.1